MIIIISVNIKLLHWAWCCKIYVF